MKVRRGFVGRAAVAAGAATLVDVALVHALVPAVVGATSAFTSYVGLAQGSFDYLGLAFTSSAVVTHVAVAVVLATARALVAEVEVARKMLSTAVAVAASLFDDRHLAHSWLVFVHAFIRPGVSAVRTSAGRGVAR